MNLNVNLKYFFVEFLKVLKKTNALKYRSENSGSKFFPGLTLNFEQLAPRHSMLNN